MCGCNSITASGIVGLVLHSRTHCLNGRENIKQFLEDVTSPLKNLEINPQNMSNLLKYFKSYNEF